MRPFIFGLLAFVFWADYLLAQNFVSQGFGKLWGLYAQDDVSFFEFENKLGVKPDARAVFLGWDELFPSGLADQLKSENQKLLIFWEPNDVSLDEIISGQKDTYIRTFAQEACLSRAEILLAPFCEMNGNWNSWSGTVGDNSPQKLVSAWRHIRFLFRQSRARNVDFVWVVNHVSVPDIEENQISQYYPGRIYVDYVGVDGFNFGNPWQGYEEIFSRALRELEKFRKPVLITSMACAEGQRKPAWIEDALCRLKANPNVRGFIWFNENKEKDWRVDSDADCLEAFDRGVE